MKKKTMKQRLSVLLALALSATLLASPANMLVTRAAEEGEEIPGGEEEYTSLFEGVTIESTGNILKKYGEDMELAVNVSGGESLDLRYEWYKAQRASEYDDVEFDEENKLEGEESNTCSVSSEGEEAYGEYVYRCEVIAESENITESVYVDFNVLVTGTLACIMYKDFYYLEDGREDVTVHVGACSTEGEVTYQWKSEGYDDVTGEDYTNIDGAVESSYTLKKEDLKNGWTELACCVSDGKSSRTLSASVLCYFYSVECESEVQIKPNQSATLSVNVNSSEDLAPTYQWYHRESEYDDEAECWVNNLVEIEGATDSTYTTEVFEEEGSADYVCEIKIGDMVECAYIGVRVIENLKTPLEIDYEQYYEFGYDEDDNYISEMPTLSVTANKENVTYQWYNIGNYYFGEDEDEYDLDLSDYIIDGATSATYTPEKSELAGYRTRFICKVTELEDEDSDYRLAHIRLYYDSGLTVEVSTSKNIVEVNKETRIVADAKGYEGDGDITYQWYTAEDDEERDTWEEIEGATSSTLSYTPTQEGLVMLVCEVTNDSGSRYDYTYVTAFDLSNIIAITSEGVDLSQEQGSRQLMAYTPEEDGEYFVFSKGNGDPAVTVYDSNLTAIADDDDDGGEFQFKCRFEGKAGETYYFLIRALSDGDITVFVNTAGAEDEGFHILNNGNTAIISLENGGDISVETDKEEGLTYQWYYYDEEYSRKYLIKGATQKTYHINATDVEQSGPRYLCKVSDGTITKEATYSVEYSSFCVEKTYFEEEAMNNETRTFAVNATSSRNLTYQWYRSVGENVEGYQYEELEGETGATLTTVIEFEEGRSEREYKCVISDGICQNTVLFWLIKTEGVHEHEWETEYTVDKEATCTEAGSKSIHCTGCSDVMDVQEIPMKSHTEIAVSGKEATCTEAGLTAGTKCSACGTPIVAQEEIKALGHVEVTIPEKEATCTEAGLTAGTKCDRCKEVLVEQKEIPAEGHTFGAWKVVKSAGCEDKGSEARNCTECGKTETRDLDAKGHSWETDYTIDKAATCTEDGSKSKHCSNCTAVIDSKVIPAKGHTEVEVEGKAATCTETGLTAGKKCSVCGTSLVGAVEIPMLEHSWTPWMVTKEATALETGIYGSSCTVCGKTDSVEIPKLTATIKVTPTKKTIKKKKSFTLTISNLAKGDGIKSVTTSKKSVATVKKVKTNKYKITGKKKGKATITVTLKSGKKATCKVTVK